MSIATELTRIQQAKADIKTAIEAKGVTVPSSATIDTYDDYVSQISGGGGIPIPSELSSVSFNKYGKITSAIIKSGVTTIEYGAFSFCNSLSNITIPDSVTSIGEYAFASTNISSIAIPSGVTSIPNNFIYNNSGLLILTMSDGVTSIGNSAFQGCSNFKSFNSNVDGDINLPTSLTTIGNQAFRNSYTFNRLTIPSGVTSIGNSAFQYCTSLNSITCLAIAPPTLGTNVFNNTNDCVIYVPANSVSSYQSAWSSYASRIQAIPNN